MRNSPLPFLIAIDRAKNDAAALCDDSGIWLTHGDVRAEIARLTPHFTGEQRKLIFCCAPRSSEGALAYLAVAASGHAIAMADPATPHIDSLAASYEPDWIIGAPDCDFENYTAIEWPLSKLRLLKRENSAAQQLHPDLYLLMFTSSSTGNSKGVRLSYANIASNTQAIITSLGLSPDTRALLHMPLFYSFGLSVLHIQLAVGGSCVLTEQGMMTREFWKLAREQKANLFPGVPYHYEMLAKLGLDRVDVPDLKIFLQAGGKMRDDLTRDMWRDIEQRQGKLFVMYGQTEAAPRISCLPVHERPEKIGACGKSLSGGELVIENGEVIYTGPNVMMGYAESRTDLARGNEMHGHLKTGDSGHIDEDSYLTVTGRLQRFAKLYGQRISLDDIEKIADTIAVEAEDKIILVTTAQEETERQRLHALTATKTGLKPAWLEVRGVSAIPYNANGKIDYPKLRKML